MCSLGIKPSNVCAANANALPLSHTGTRKLTVGCARTFFSYKKEKTEAIAFGNRDEVLKVNAYLDSRGQKTKSSQKNIGVILERDLSFSSHVKAVSSQKHCRNWMFCFQSRLDDHAAGWNIVLVS